MCSGLLKIAVLASGGGSNLQSLIDAKNVGFFESEIKIVITNKENAYALERAKNHNIETHYINDDELLVKTLIENEIDLIVLAGYLKILDENILSKFEGRIINIHPSLLPKYGGKGMYGIHVHEAVFANKEKQSGATVHFVTKEIDGGDIILQKSIDISNCETPQRIQETVLDIEHEIFKEALLIVEKGLIYEKSAN